MNTVATSGRQQDPRVPELPSPLTENNTMVNVKMHLHKNVFTDVSFCLVEQSVYQAVVQNISGLPCFKLQSIVLCCDTQ